MEEASLLMEEVRVLRGNASLLMKEVRVLRVSASLLDGGGARPWRERESP